MRRLASLTTAALVLLALPAFADPPIVVAATASRDGATWTFDVTLLHPDTGWDHYASGWEILSPDGTDLGYRDLTHPHVEEQPFTRSLSGVVVPEGIHEVFIRPRCTLDGWVGAPTRLALPE